MRGHVLQAEVVGEAGVAATVAAGVGVGPDDVDAAAVPVVEDGLLDAVTVGVELRADVAEGVPLRGVLQSQRDRVVGPHVHVAGV
jgi:hypothetical protein